MAQQLEIRLFGSTGCPQCERVENGVVREVRLLYPEVIYSKTLTDDIEGFKKLLQLEEHYGDDRNKSVKVFVGGFPDNVTCLAGVEEIEAELIGRISNVQQGISNVQLKPSTNDHEILERVPESKDGKTAEKLAQKRVERFTIGAVIAAGLIDGVNPCVFSTLVFFMGLLAASQVRGHKLLVIGLSFCFGSFVMYTSMGFGLLQLLRSFWGFEIIQSAIKWLMVAAMAWFAFDSLRGALYLKKSGVNAGDACNLPIGVISKIHRAIQSGISGKYLIAGAFGAGLVVTAFESMCTGQVYVPTLVLIIQSGASQLTGWAYLLLFNLACITPLLLIFILVYRGMNFSIFETWSQKHQYESKLILLFFFVTMAIVMILV